jgi:CHASE3 domain sensor protein
MSFERKVTSSLFMAILCLICIALAASYSSAEGKGTRAGVVQPERGAAANAAAFSVSAVIDLNEFP